MMARNLARADMPGLIRLGSTPGPDALEDSASMPVDVIGKDGHANPSLAQRNKALKGFPVSFLR